MQKFLRTPLRLLSFLVLSWVAVLVPLVVVSCQTLNAAVTPAQVVTTVHLRTQALATAEQSLAAGQLADPALVQVLVDDEAAWKYLRDETNHFVASSDFLAVLQTQEIGVRVARKKIVAGEYAPTEKLELVHTLGAVWTTLETYYTPKVP